MIIKSISTRNSSALIKYIFRPEKVAPTKSGRYITNLRERYEDGRAVYIGEQRVTKEQLHHLIAEYDDKMLYEAFKKYKGTPQEFIQERLLNIMQVQDLLTGRIIYPFVVTKNLRGNTVQAFIREFDEVNERRQHKREAQIQATHFILSFHTSDARLLTDEKLRVMAKEFTKYLGDNHVSCIAKHAHTGHATHLHVAVAQTLLDGKGFRWSRDKLSEVKKSMDVFQAKHFPELSQSLPKHGKGKHEKIAEIPYKFAERSNIKNSLLCILNDVYTKATSREHFFEQLRTQHNIQLYSRNNDSVETGLIFQGLRFRYSRLETFDVAALQALDHKAKTAANLKELSDIRARATERQRGRTIVEPIQQAKPDTTPLDAKLQELAAIRAQAQEQSRDESLDVPSAPESDEQQDTREDAEDTDVNASTPTDLESLDDADGEDEP